MKKRLLLLTVFVGMVFSCKKSGTSFSPDGDYNKVFQSVLSVLRDSLSSTDLARLDATRGFVTVMPHGQALYWRFAFRDAPVTNSFVLVRTDAVGHLGNARIVDLVNKEPRMPNLNSGSVTVRNLGGRVVLRSEIWGGFILALHPRLQAIRNGVATFEADGDDDDDDGDGGTQEFPPVYVLARTGGGGGGGGGSYYSLGALDGYLGGYGPANPGLPIGGGGGVSTSKGIPAPTEYSNNLKIVNLKNMFNCFTVSPTAVYQLSLCTDVPDNDDPEAVLGLSTGNSTIGHSFLVMTEISGTGVTTQSFGFYPSETPPFWNPTAAVPSATKDNGGHEINASVTITVSAAQFSAAQSAALAGAGNQYQLVNYNCTNFAVSVFNAVSPTQVTCQPLNISTSPAPGSPSVTVTIPESPQGLFAALSSLKTAGGPLAGDISTDLSGNTTSPNSHGECN